MPLPVLKRLHYFGAMQVIYFQLLMIFKLLHLHLHPHVSVLCLYNIDSTSQKQQYNRNSMSASLTTQKLLVALKDNKSYSQTQPFLKAISDHSGQSVMSAINQALMETLSQQKNSLVSKLLVLRMVKDIFITGNIEYFDLLDEEIEDAIITAAAYNPQYRAKSKGKNQRGSAYFVETEQRPKNADTAKYGNSFVLLATQMVKNFATLLPSYPDGSPFRFIEYYQELQKLGVAFEENIYFEESDKKTFQVNFQKWRSQFLKSQESAESMKISESALDDKLKKSSLVSSIPDVLGRQTEKDRALWKAKLDQQLQKYELLKRGLTKQYEDQITQLKYRNEQQQIKMREAIAKHQDLQTKNRSYEIEKKELQAQIELAEQRNGKFIQQIADHEARMGQSELKGRTIEMERDKNQNEKNIQISKLEQQLQKLQQNKTQIYDRMCNIEKLKQKVDEQYRVLREQNAQLKEELKRYQNAKTDQLNKQIRQQNVILQTRVRILQEQLSQMEEENLRARQQTKKVTVLMKKQQSENSKLFDQIVQQQQYNKKMLQQSTNVSVQYNQRPESQNVNVKLAKQKRNNDQNKMQALLFRICDKQNNNQSNINSQLKNIVDVCNTEPKKQPVQMSLSKFLFNQQFQQTASNCQQALSQHPVTDGIHGQFCKKSSQSLHKTQSSKHRSWKHARGSVNNHKQSVLQDYTNNYNYNFNNNQHYIDQPPNLVLKNVMTSVFPYMSQYFYPIVSLSESQQFRKCCALHNHCDNTFFQDKLFTMQIIKNSIGDSTLHQKVSSRDCQILIRNKSPNPISLKLISETTEVVIKSSNQHNINQYEKIGGFMKAVYQLGINVASLNFRFPIFKLQVVQDKKQSVYRVPIPITLLDALELSQSVSSLRKFNKFQQNFYKKHRSEWITVKSSLYNTTESIALAFPLLHFKEMASCSSREKQLISECIVTFAKIPEVEIKLRIILHQRACQFETEFLTMSKVSEDFSKVFLQVLMFIFQ